jgi:hypothetical protein
VFVAIAFAAVLLPVNVGAAQLVGPTLGTWIWQHEGPDALWTSCLGLSLVVALALIASGPARHRRLAIQPGLVRTD